MLRRLNSTFFRNVRRSITVSIERHVRGGAASSPVVSESSSTTVPTRFGYGIKRGAMKGEEINATTEPSQRVASLYGHPRFPPREEEEPGPISKRPEFNEIEEDEFPRDEETRLDKEEAREEFTGESARTESGTRINQYESLDRPQPAPRRKSRSFLQTYTLTTMVNDSELLRNFVDIGVNLSRFDTLHNVADWLVKLDWDKDVKPVLRFLNEIGIPLENLGEFVTANPWILQQTQDDLRVRIRYLESKKFSSEAIARIVVKAKYWLNFHVKTIDKRLGFLQTEFKLSGDEVRFVVTHSPKLITIGTGYIQLLQFAFKQEMGFNEDEMRELILKDPKAFISYKEVMVKSFDYLHNTMNFTHQQILAWPSILRAPRHYLQQRHEFLKSLGRDQYDPTKPNYVSLQALGNCSDQTFAEQVAKTTISEYNKFLKKY